VAAHALRVTLLERVCRLHELRAERHAALERRHWQAILDLTGRSAFTPPVHTTCTRGSSSQVRSASADTQSAGAGLAAEGRRFVVAPRGTGWTVVDQADPDRTLVTTRHAPPSSAGSVTAPEGWVPAFEGQRPPFQPGHTLSVRHGTYSVRLVGEDAAAMLEELRESGAPWLAEVDGAELEAWLRAESQVRRLAEHLDKVGVLDGKGNPRPAAAELRAFERLAAARRAALGLNPSARAVLGRDTAVARAAAQASLRTEMRRGKELLDGQAQQQEAGDV